ncbi:MAG: 16S rRNA (uracil(1498)-N(3))-methyltransferase [Rhodobacteraceae bacterium]|nr:16S rRNA (uracil(1498)-N(3))-methyltransferase [Paracoccaceae bacterium]
MSEIRLHVAGPLTAEKVLPLNGAQSLYLFGVMRCKLRDSVRVFDGHSGEWQAEVVKANKRNGLLLCKQQTAPQETPPDLWLMFAPVKKARTSLIVEKAVEMGVRDIRPVVTEFTNERLKTNRLQAHAIEAAEQCGSTYVPKMYPPVKLNEILESWPSDRRIMFCDEGRAALPVVQALVGQEGGKWAILIGPEGGFSQAEAEALRAMKQVVSVMLGPRILRADTAVVAAIGAWQMALGDWR